MNNILGEGVVLDEKRINDEYERLRSYFPNYVTPLQEIFMRQAFTAILTNRDTSVVSTICERCGVGKSTFIHAFMQYSISEDYYQIRKHPIGLIVITDSVKRLEEAADTSKDKANLPDDYKELFEALGEPKHFEELKKQIIVLKSGEPFIDQLRRQHYKSIVLLTTQRYFMLSEDVREQLFWFEHDGVLLERQNVLFDEKPYFWEPITYQQSDILDIEGALRDGIPNNIPEKEFVLREFIAFKERLFGAMREVENMRSTSVRRYWQDRYAKTVTSNDSLFLSVIDSNIDSLMAIRKDIRKDIFYLPQIAAEGAIINSTKQSPSDGEKYELSINSIRDNRSCFYLGGTRKFFVFDATADIDPVYQVEYVQPVQIKKIQTPIKLTIDTVKFAATKGALAQRRKRKTLPTLSKAMKQYSAENFTGEYMVLLTYQDIWKYFKNDFRYVRYLGNLKGFNDFKDFQGMIHLGLNRFSDMAYLKMYYGIHPDKYRELQEMSDHDSGRLLDQIFDRKASEGDIRSELKEIISNSILADFEQNIFRLCIRNLENKEMAKVLLLYDYGERNPSNTMEMFRRKLEQRLKPLGVQFTYSDKFIQMGLAKIEDKKSTDSKVNNVQKVMNFLTGRKKGEIFFAKDILAATGLNNKQLQKTKNNPALKALFESIKTGEKGQYCFT